MIRLSYHERRDKNVNTTFYYLYDRSLWQTNRAGAPGSLGTDKNIVQPGISSNRPDWNGMQWFDRYRTAGSGHLWNHGFNGGPDIKNFKTR